MVCTILFCQNLYFQNVNSDTGVCSGNGVCRNTDPQVADTTTCSCNQLDDVQNVSPDYVGTYCQYQKTCTPTDMTTMRECYGRGTCIPDPGKGTGHYICQCSSAATLQGWTGPECNIQCPVSPVNQQICSGSAHGVCRQDGSCECKQQVDGTSSVYYGGEACEIDMRALCSEQGFTGALCSGNGECDPVSGCACDPAYKGRICEQTQCGGTVECSLHGTCQETEQAGTFSCQCDSQGINLYAGDQCETDATIACGVPVGVGSNEYISCHGHGSCQIVDDSAKCVCDNGYTGVK